MVTQHRPGRDLLTTAGRAALWLGFGLLVAAIVIQLVSATAPDRDFALLLVPFVLMDLLCIRIEQRRGGFATTMLVVDGLLKTFFVMSFVMVATLVRPHLGPIVKGPLDDVAPMALLFTGPVTLLGAALTRLSR